MVKTEELIRDSYDSLVIAIRNHLIEYSLGKFPCELRLYVEPSGTLNLKSEFGITKKIWNGEYYVLCSTGGVLTPWDIIGNVFECLREDDLLDLIPGENNSKSYVEEFIEENHPELIQRWLAKYDENNYDSEIIAAEEILEAFLENMSATDYEDEDE